MESYLSPELHKRLCQALLDCEEFDATMRLQGDLAKYNRVFEYPYKTKEKLVESTINYLIKQSIQRVRYPVFPHFLMILYSTLREDSELRDELEMLHTLVEIELDEIAKPQTTPFAQTTPKTASDMKQIADPSPTSPTTTDLMNDIFLDRDDRKEIEKILTNLLDTRGLNNEGKKHLLRDCELPDVIIKAIHFHEASGNVAEEIVGLTATWDQPHPTLKYLENFVLNMVREAGYTGNEVEKIMKGIIARYNQKRKIYASKMQHRGYQAPLKPEDYATAQKLQAFSDSPSNLSQMSPYKIDVSMIIQCNLGTQRKCFTTGFNERFKGFFTFAVASVEYTVLKEYVLGCLLWELKKNTPRPTRVRHISLYSQFIDFSNVEQGSISIQKQIQQFLGGKSLRDLLEDTQDDNLAIVLWTTNNLPYNFKDIALLFSETVKQQVSDILQNRCFILFWAKYGPAPIEPLAVSGALPAFERFEVEHIIDWLDVSLSYQLKAQNISEQEIKYWRTELVKKIEYHNGHLPGTYDCLLEPLERRGAF